MTSLAAVAALVLAVALVLHRPADGEDRLGPGSTSRQIPAQGDITLAARVRTPYGHYDHPLVVLPVPFAAPADTYDGLAQKLVAKGYEVVSYAQRGFGDSGGLVDLAGDATQQDVSTVITWALAHTRSEADHVGLLGESYGAGVGLLAAAHDSRIRAVAALSAWTDLASSFDQNNTPSTAAIRNLIDRAGKRLDPSLQPLVESIGTAAFPDALRAIAATRSPQTYVDQLNTNGTTVLLANTYGDSYFAPGQLVPFYEALSTPKRLQLMPGDHGGPEQSGLAGHANPVTAAAVGWLDHFLRGTANGAQDGAPIRLTDAETGKVIGYQDWPGTDARPIALRKPNTAVNVGKPAAWTASLPSRSDSGVDLGPLPLDHQGLAVQTVGRTSTWITSRSLRWSGRTLTTDRAVAGMPRVQVGLAGSSALATVFAYLCDVAPDRTARLITSAPYTAVGLTKGKARAVSIALQPVAWTVPKGHHLVLVVDTSDRRYTSLTSAAEHVTLSSTLDYPATATVAVLAG